MKIKKILQINLRGLILSISIASMLVTLTNGYLSIYNVYKELFANQLAKINIDYSSRLAASVENILSVSKKQMTYSARFISKYFPDTNQIQEETDRIYQLSQNFNSVIIVDNNNNLVAFSPESNVLEVNKLVADTGHSPLQPDNVAASLPYKTNENDYAIALSAPIVNEQDVHLGDIRGSIHLTKLRIMNFSDGADGRTRVMRRRLLFNGNGRRQPFDMIDVRFFHQGQKLPGIRRQRFHVTSLPLGVEGVKSQR